MVPARNFLSEAVFLSTSSVSISSGRTRGSSSASRAQRIFRESEGLKPAFRSLSAPWINEAVAAVFFVALIFALAGMRRHGGRYDVLAGYALQLSALLWVCVSANFMGAYPPINTGALVYALVAALCWTCGCHLWTRGKLYRRVRSKRAGGAVHE